MIYIPHFASAYSNLSFPKFSRPPYTHTHTHTHTYAYPKLINFLQSCTHQEHIRDSITGFMARSDFERIFKRSELFVNISLELPGEKTYDRAPNSLSNAVFPNF